MATQIQPTTEGFVTDGGHRVHYERFGTGEREAICLLNGLAMHTKAWYGFVPMLHPELDVVLYDYLGQGESDAPDEPLSISRLADHLALVCDRLAIARLHVMGISYGGFVAIEFARRHRERLLTLALSGILVSREELFEMYEAMSLAFYRRGPDVFGLYTQYLYEKIFGEAFVRKVTREGLEPMRARFEERFRGQIHALIRLTEAQEEYFGRLEERWDGYRSVTAPVLVMPGEQDRAIPLWQQRKLLDAFPHSRWHPIPECGHVAYLERPDVFFPTLKAFAAARSLDFEPVATG